MRSKTIKFNNTFEYLVPSYVDPEGSNVRLKVLTMKNQSFEGLFHYVMGDVLVFNPRSWPDLYIGTFDLQLELSDSQKSNYYPFSLTITNSPAYFSGGLPSKYKCRFNTTCIYRLPQIKDDENNEIFI